MTFHTEYLETNTLMYKYAMDRRNVDLDTMLSELEVDPKGKAGLLLANGRLTSSAQREWTNRLTYWCSRHHREYRIRYDEDRHLTVLACTNSVWRSGRDQKQLARATASDPVSYVVRLGGTDKQ